MAQLCYGHTNGKLQEIAGELAYSFGKRPSSKPLSNNWLYSFLKRWDHRVSNKKSRALDSYRAKSTTPETVESYYNNLQKIVESYDLADKPQFIYNVDETGIQPEHRPPNVIAPINSKPQAVTSPRSTTTTVIGCVNAIGNSLPPFFIFKGARFNPDLMKGATPGARGTMSKSGWSNSEVFRDYLESHFLPNVRRGVNDNQHVLLILDGHASHVSHSLIEWANSQNLILFVLPAHTSHLLQPLDVSIFGPFKSCYYNECAAFMREHLGQTITRYEMCAVACKAYLKATTPSNIVAGFRKTGIFPFAKDAVPKEKLFPSEPFRDESPVQKVTAIKAGREAIEKFLLEKVEKQLSSAVCCCKCAQRPTAPTSKRPKPGGKAITEESFRQEMEEQHNELQKCRKRQKTDSPKPSTSGIITINQNNSDPEDDDDYEPSIDESQLCCVCHRFSPPNLNEKPYLKIVNWAQCDQCSHWVHLSFCTKRTVVRRNDSFLCHHCV